MKNSFFYIFFLLLLFLSTEVNAQVFDSDSNEPSSTLTVSLVTFGPGEEVWERFGHNAIEIRDGASGEARLYNYGMFDFAQENFFLNFARGRMVYRMAAGDPGEEYPLYLAEGRRIVRQRLNLAPAQRARLADYLEWNARPENAQYRYDYFRANCSTRVRDALDAALDGAIKAQLSVPSRGFTYRMDVDRLMRPDPALMLAIDAGLGPDADRPLSYWDESFVPMEFMRHAREIVLHDADGAARPLVADETVLNEGRLPAAPESPPHWTWGALAAGLLAALILPGLARLRANAAARTLFALAASAIALACGLGGVILACLWAFTEHTIAWRNENLLLFDPLCLLLLPAWLGALRQRWQPSRFARRAALLIALLAALAGFVKILPGFAQDNGFWIALLLPLHAALALCPGIVLTLSRSRKTLARTGFGRR